MSSKAIDHKNLFWPLLLAISLSLFSCEKTNEVNPSQWESYSPISYESKLIYNSTSYNDRLILLGNK